MTGSRSVVADVGGTNARFALANSSGPRLSHERTFRVADYETFDAAFREYVQGLPGALPQVMCVAAAGPVVEGRVVFTNNDWVIDRTALTRDLDLEKVEVVNDFEAIAYAIPSLDSDDHISVGPVPNRTLSESDFTVAVLGPGTGLGAVGLCKRRNILFPIVSEGGHVGFAPETEEQLDVMRVLRVRFDRLSAERLVSGPGIENLYWALAQLDGSEERDVGASEIFERAVSGSDALAVGAVGLFFEILGQVAGDLALTLGAVDGVYIAGGIARRYPDLLSRSRFRSAFDRKGRHGDLMESTPTLLVTHPEPGLLGAGSRAIGMVH